MIRVGGMTWHGERSGSGRIAPAEYRDAVELHARQFGAHADIVWVPEPVNMWQVRLTLKPGDPRLKGEGDEKVETVELHEWLTADEWRKRDSARAPRDRRGIIRDGYRSFELDELGVSGLIEFLEKGSVQSGRGQFASATDAATHVQKQHEKKQEKERRDHRDDAKHKYLDVRRKVLKIPFLPIGIDLRKETNS